jgi:hypothetical protein
MILPATVVIPSVVGFDTPEEYFILYAAKFLETLQGIETRPQLSDRSRLKPACFKVFV